MDRKFDSNAQGINREQLKEILEVNYKLYKSEPHFFDYITDLVIYLMEYEFEDAIGDAPKESHPQAKPSKSITTRSALESPAAGLKEGFSQGARPLDVKSGEKHISPHKRISKSDGDHCPHCNNQIDPEATLCPYCLAIVRSEP